MNKNLNFNNTIVSTFGTFFISMGIAFLVNGDYGVDTISTFILGVLNFINVPFWLASMTFNVTVLVITYVLDYKELGIGSLINAVGIGVLLKFLNPFFSDLSSVHSLYSAIAALLGPILIGVGGAIYISSGLGAAALEALTNIINRNTNLTIKVIRMILDGSLVLAGLLLGSSIGIGTILCVLLIGPVLEFTLSQINNKKITT